MEWWKFLDAFLFFAGRSANDSNGPFAGEATNATTELVSTRTRTAAGKRRICWKPVNLLFMLQEWTQPRKSPSPACQMMFSPCCYRSCLRKSACEPLTQHAKLCITPANTRCVGMSSWSLQCSKATTSQASLLSASSMDAAHPAFKHGSQASAWNRSVSSARFHATFDS